MVMYAIALIPFVESLATEGAVQAWYADDSGAGGRLKSLRKWWDRPAEKGPRYGYFPNPTTCKSVLVVKPQFSDDATRIFAGTGVTIRTDGCRYLGAAIGSAAFIEQSVQQKVNAWVTQVQCLSAYARSQPQAAYAAYIHGL